MTSDAGIFTVSLDFELFWGVRHGRTLAAYRDNLLGVREAVPALLDLFARYDVHATWATVGLLFFESRDALLAGLPARRPAYADARLSPYEDLDRIGADESDDPFHFAPSLVQEIRSRPGQEIGTHTFSHYFCLEDGQDPDAFADDLSAAQRVASTAGVELTSLVFPRNQLNADYLAIARDAGIVAYRGNESSWMYRPVPRRDESRPRRLARLLDAYVNLSGHHGHSRAEAQRTFPFDIPSSRFLRPYSPRLKALEPLRLRRIRQDLRHAAKHGLIYHLWWHPHNFGTNLDRNLAFLEQILDEFSTLRAGGGMQSLNMGEVAQSLGGGAT